MQHNLPLYIECVNSKNDLLRKNGVTNFSTENTIKRMLSEIHKTYKFIIENYFYSISDQFEPFFKEEEKLEFKISITGGINESSLYYWFDIVDKCAPDIKIISAGNIRQANQEYLENILTKKASMIQRSTNLELSGLVGDSGRKIAIDVIKDNLNKILKDQSLPASHYVLCEILKETIDGVPWLKDIEDIGQMSKEVSKRIHDVLEESPSVPQIFTSEGVELFSLNRLLSLLQCANVNYKSSIVPGRDREYTESNGLVLDLYSTERKIEIAETFFKFAEVSYLEMVKNSFPNIYKYFSKYQDMPYKLRIIYWESNREPWVDIYHVAHLEYDNSVEVRLGDLEDDLWDIYNEITQSYQSLNRASADVCIRSIRFSNLLFSRNLSENTPLTDYIYKDIKSSLEEIFGEI